MADSDSINWLKELSKSENKSRNIKRGKGLQFSSIDGWTEDKLPKLLIVWNFEKESTAIGFIAGPFLARPIISGPTGAASLGNCELSISSIKTPGDINLNFLSDIYGFLLFKAVSSVKLHTSLFLVNSMSYNQTPSVLLNQLILLVNQLENVWVAASE